MFSLCRTEFFTAIATMLTCAFIATFAAAHCPCEDTEDLATTEPAATQPSTDVLRVAADPNDMPFSNAKAEGFENRIAALIAQDLGLRLEYQWLPQRLGFFRETLKNGDADLVMGVPAGFERSLTTLPYYRSSYVFVTRRAAGLTLGRFDDPTLRTLRIGLQLTGGVNAPPAQVLGARGLVNNLVGFPVFADAADGDSRIVHAVAAGNIDAAIVWGPLAGYFASREDEPLTIAAAQSDEAATPGLPLAFDICIGVRRGESELRDRINDVLRRRRAEIDAILQEYHVPHMAPASTTRSVSEMDP